VGHKIKSLKQNITYLFYTLHVKNMLAFEPIRKGSIYFRAK